MTAHPFKPLAGSIGPICIECRKPEFDPLHLDPTAHPHLKAPLAKILDECEYSPMGNSVPMIEQALNVARLLPPDEPARLDLLRQCARHLSGALNYVGVITEEAK